MPFTKKELNQLLVVSDFLTEQQLEKAIKNAKDRGVPIEQVLVDDNILTDDEVGRLFADAYGVRFLELSKLDIDANAASDIPEIVAKKQLVISPGWKNGKRVLAMVDPRNLELISLLKKKIGEEIEVVYTTPNELIEALASYSADVRKEVINLVRQFKEKGGKEVEDKVVKALRLMIRYGYDNDASDIHIEPHEKEALVRFRIDGVLHDIFHIPKPMHELAVARIKILSNLRTDEHFAAQDGKFRVRFSGDKIDVRVSIVPIVEGEKAVLRLLSEKGRTFTLEHLGLSGTDLERINRAIKKPYGMILATGPTGSGKTTTLYATLNILNKRDVNIATIEDPVEYDVDGVNQIQVNTRTNLTFAKGLRSIVRQDPDIILVGEIRDNETASIAVNAAMTGHLVLSTLHTNDAATALPRLLEMKVEPFLIASSVNVIIAQRLVRKICKNCITSVKVDLTKFSDSIPKDIYTKLFAGKKSIRAFKGKGCSVCHDSGYIGRIGIYEVLEITDEIRQMISQRANASEISKKAQEQGMTLMLEDGLRKVLAGITTINEVVRVVK